LFYRSDTSTLYLYTTSWTAVSGGGGGGVTDHGNLTGLTDDDHTQYALADGTRGTFASTSHNHDAAYVNVTGDTMTGTLVLNNTTASGGQIRLKSVTNSANYGVLMRADVGAFGLLVTNNDDADGSFNSRRPFMMTLSTGDISSNTVWTFDGIPVFNGGTSGSTAPFTVDSTTVVTNLNADYVDGKSFGTFVAGGILFASNTTSATTSTAGVTGQVLTSAGGGTPTWSTVASGATTPSNIMALNTNTTLAAGDHAVCTNSISITLPTAPSSGDSVIIKNLSTGSITVVRNGSKIEQLDEDLVIDTLYISIWLRYLNATVGWVIT
jgi:hypothetical protein